jgi:hypothetical protein
LLDLDNAEEEAAEEPSGRGETYNEDLDYVIIYREGNLEGE